MNSNQPYALQYTFDILFGWNLQHINAFFGLFELQSILQILIAFLYLLLFAVVWCFCEQGMVNVVVSLQRTNSSSDNSGWAFSQMVAHLQIKQVFSTNYLNLLSSVSKLFKIKINKSGKETKLKRLPIVQLINQVSGVWFLWKTCSNISLK